MNERNANIRASAKTVFQKRKAKSCCFLVTGGTGFIGSHIAVELLKTGYPVIILARRRGSLSAKERVRTLLDWFGLDPSFESRLAVLEGNLGEPYFGLDKTRYDQLADAVDEIIHCASDTSFSERKRAEIEKANVSNLDGLLDLAAKNHCYFFHHVSTAYVAGKKSGSCPEESINPREFTNVYEETKCRAEAKIVARCANEGITLNVYRPSIIYGNSTSGKTLLFNGFYYPVRTVVFLRNIYEKDINENQGKKAREMGVKKNGDNSLFLPLRVAATASGGVNLISIDYFVRAFMAVLDQSLGGGFFHIVNTKLTTIEELADYTRRFFHVEGIVPVSDDTFAKVSKNALEILFEQYIEAYGPYMRDTRIFENRRTRSILEKRDITCPEFDFDVFSRCMKYAEKVQWGTKLFDRAK